MRNFRPWYYDSLFWSAFFFDRISKWVAIDLLRRPIFFSKNVSFGIVLNRGAAWGLFQSNSQTQWFFLLLSVVIFCVLCFLAKYTLDRQEEGLCVTGETLFLAGGFSNFVDRLRYGGVVDFIKISFGKYSFPVFNIADVVITVGVIIMIYTYIFDDE